jgi:hypothetical protein
VALSEAQTKEVAGSYGHGLVVVSADGSALHLAYGGAGVELLPLGGDRFLADPGSSIITVKVGRGPDGKVRNLSAQGMTLPRDP